LTRLLFRIVAVAFITRSASCSVAVLAMAALGLPSAGVAAEKLATPADIEFYERKIRPLLAERCYECHSATAKRVEAGLALDTQAGVRKGGENGPLINSTKHDASLLLDVVAFEGDIQMPPTGKLRAEEIALLNQWVSRGAAMPEDGSAAIERRGIDYAAGKQFWSFQPLRQVPVPRLRNAEAPLHPIDAWLQAAQETQGLAPSPAADARTLIRRATFDLLGLPPTPEEVEQFVHDRSPQAYERLLDRLLESPHYGERWGRYWLDLARYADGNKTSLEERGQAWLYRDWVVKALNEDLPYDEFVRRQLAADKIPGLYPAELAALGFLGGSPIYFKELKLAPPLIRSIVADEWEERIDALGRTFLGLSLACARCHDHKFDPIGAEDYYALAGVLASTRLVDVSVISAAETKAVHEAVKQVKALMEKKKKLLAAKPMTPEIQAEIASLEKQIETLEHETPHYHSATAHGLSDAALEVLPDGPARTKLVYKPGEAVDLAIHIRGNPMKTGPVVPRRFLTVLCPDSPRTFVQGSGRLELAQALVTDAAPLTARVIVNRVWAYHFGRGLVETVSDFGSQGERPSHPELLDDLALRFVNQGWSLKRLHREIMATAAYRQSSAFDAAKHAVDPGNRLLWRMNRRRLDVEAWRDALLASCGNLDPQRGGPPVTLDYPKNHRRTLYARIERSKLDDMLRLFDFPEPSSHSPNRQPTTTALQQLFVLNGPLMQQQAKVLAKKLVADTPADADSPIDAAAIVTRAYHRLFARVPSENELRLGVDYLNAGGAKGGLAAEAVERYAQALLGSNEFLFVD
jgi:hypothetical protein